MAIKILFKKIIWPFLNVTYSRQYLNFFKSHVKKFIKKEIKLKKKTLNLIKIILKKTKIIILLILFFFPLTLILFLFLLISSVIRLHL